MYKKLAIAGACLSFFTSIQASNFSFDNDTLADIAVSRLSNGAFYIRNSSGQDFNSTRGDGIQRHFFERTDYDVPITGDFDGDGIRDFGLRRLSTAEWIIQHSSTGEVVTREFGRRVTDVPVPADYDGDGITDIAVYRSENLTWYILNSSGVDRQTNNKDGISRIPFGEQASDFPVPADYDGDGKADIAIRQADTQYWLIRNSSGVDPVTGNSDGITRHQFGKRAEDLPVPADYDGDGKADLAVRRPSTQTWYILNSSGTDSNTGYADGITRRQFGMRSSDIPVVADYDGDGRSDIAVRRPGTQLWYVLNSSGSDLLSGHNDGVSRLRFGLRATDIPLVQPAYSIFYQLDLDGDGLNNGEEVARGSSPIAADTDGDNVADSQDAFPLDPNESSDADNDGVGDNSDLYPNDPAESADSDNDGVGDNADAFPLDPNETTDTDADGVGDNSDAYPDDNLCSALSDGDGESCYLRLLNGDKNNLLTTSSAQYLLIYSPAADKIYPFDLATRQFLALIEMPDTRTAIAIHHAPQSNRIYVVLDDGEVGYFEDNQEYHSFVDTISNASFVQSLDNYVLIGNNGNLYVYDESGVLTSSVNIGSDPRSIYWDSEAGQLFTAVGSSYYFYLSQFLFNVETGELSLEKQEYFYSGDSYQGPMFQVENEPDVIMIGSSVFSRDSLSYLGEWNALSVSDFESVSGSNEILTLAYQAGKSILNRYDGALSLLEAPQFDGFPTEMAQYADAVVVLTKELHSLRLHVHELLDDIDGDGIQNDIDDFPADIAASVDSDQDGYPDSWNIGLNELDSSTGLTLDVFPEDAVCWDVSHDDGFGDCNYGATMPDFIPEQIIADDNGTLYLFNASSDLIYRWSSQTQRYLSPLSVGESNLFSSNTPISVAYSEAHNRLYLGYLSGQITFITPDSNETEIPFYQTTGPVRYLISTGNFLVATSGSSYDSRLHSLDVNGILIDTASSSYFSGVNAWDESHNRLFYFRYSELYYIELAQTTGEFGSTSYAAGNSLSGPLHLSADSSKILMGSGHIFNTDDLTSAGFLGGFDDGMWLQNDELLLLSQLSNTIALQRKNTQGLTLETFNLSGDLVGLARAGESDIIVTLTDSGLSFIPYVANNDTDGDGVSNTADAFPNDIAAALDTDNDGYPDSWNTGYDAQDSTTGLVIDEFPQDSACWLAEHSDGQGNCDYSATVPEFVPNEIQANASGDVYLLSEAHGKVFSWSTTTEQYQNPFSVGSSSGLTNESPVRMTFSAAQERLYLGYASGLVTFIDINNSPKEQFFNHFPQEVQSLVAAGNFLVVYGSNSTLRSFDVNGLQTDVISSSNFSRYNAWNEFTDAIYYYRSYYLYKREVNQDTGEIGERNRSYNNDYYGGATGIHIAKDGSKVLLSSGDVYNAEDLSHLSQVPYPDNALWLDNDELLLLEQSGAEVVLQRKNGQNRTVETVSLSGQLIDALPVGEQNLIVTQSGSELAFTLYQPNNDIDGDGVDNVLDAFPTDVAASVDSDNDGYPDSWNDGYSEDSSTTGLTLDVFPGDAACWLDDHDNGNGGCDYSATIPQFVPDEVVADGQGNVYLFSQQYGKVFTWSATTQQYQNPFAVGDRFNSGGEAPQRVVYLEDHHRLYFGYASGLLTYIDLNSGPQEQYFYQLPHSVSSIIAADNFLVAYSSGVLYSFAADGELVDSLSSSYFSQATAWNGVYNRIYHLRDGISPRDIYYREFNPITGEFGAGDDSPYHGDYSVYGPIRISQDGSKVLLGSGDIYAQDDLTWLGNVGSLDNALWLENSELLQLTQLDSEIALRRKNDQYSTIEVSTLSGQLISLVRAGEHNVIVSQLNNELVFELFVANNDSDGDGVDNTEDAFPQDIAASIDSDNDGYPDSWNEGYTEADSTTGLVLDVFPEDAACWTAEHDDGSGTCDYMATIPNFIPDKVVADNDGNLFLLSTENSKVYTWSAALQQYQNPYIVGTTSLTNGSPDLMSYSEAHNRLYFGYDSGLITFIELSGERQEQFYFQLSLSVNGLASVGDFMLAQDESGAWATHYIINADGTLTDSRDWNYYSNEYAWNPAYNRVYYFGSNELQYEEIDPVTGDILSSGDFNNSSTYGPIRVSPDGSKILLGNGEIYSAADRSWQNSLGSLDDALWLDNDELLLLSQQDSGITVQRLNSQYQTSETLSLNGALLRAVHAGDYKVIVALVDNALSFTLYEPNNDSDGDGVENLLDAFPMDIAASVDSDNDGYPDSWNEGYSESDSTTGLILDVFPEDAACWSENHDDGSGSCDFAATVPDFVPDDIITDADGNIYMLSQSNSKVFVWSVQAQQYRNPIFVGESTEFSSAAPTAMVYSESHNRLYFGYESGNLTYVALDGSNQEQYFNRLSAFGSMVAAGNYLMVQERTTGRNRRNVFSADGTLVASSSSTYSSDQYAWSSATSKFYYLRRGYSPVDLHYQSIDQTTGALNGSGDSPYHSSTNMTGPVRVINQDSQVILGSGAIYNADNLEIMHNLETTLVDALDYAGMLLTARESDGAWFVDILSYDDYAVLTSFQLEYSILSLALHEDDLTVVQHNGVELVYSHIPLGDNDGDMLPAWWEISYGLSDSDAEDADLDLDSDGLSNLQEYLLGTYPDNTDSDADDLSDFDEVNTHNTSPLAEDTDADGINDGAEINQHGTNPLSHDTDEDGFSDSDEIFIYETDPNDAESLPDAISSLTESFEDGVTPFWRTVTDSNADWAVTSAHAADGSMSLKSGNISHSQYSAVQIEGLFTDGTLTFSARVSAESCCDKLYIYLNDVQQIVISNSGWETYEISLSNGENVIEWRYRKDGSVDTYDDAAYIDNVRFAQ